MFCSRVLPVFAIFMMLPSASAQEGRLGQVRQELHKDAPDRPVPLPEATPPRDTAVTYDESGTPAIDTDADNTLGQFIGGGAFYSVYATVAAPFVVPRRIIGDKDQELRFLRHPYLRHAPDYLLLAPEVSPAIAQTWADDPPRRWMVRLGIENGNDFDGLNRTQGQLLLDTASRFGVVTNWDYFHERLSAGRSDETTIGDVTLTYRFAQSRRVLMRTGVGCRVLTDEHTTDWGINFHYGGDWLPREPFIVTGSVDLGSLGDAFVVRTRATAGVLWRGIEAFGGYDFLRIGDVNLHGPLVGVRLWF